MGPLRFTIAGDLIPVWFDEIPVLRWRPVAPRASDASRLMHGPNCGFKEPIEAGGDAARQLLAMGARLEEYPDCLTYRGQVQGPAWPPRLTVRATTGGDEPWAVAAQIAVGSTLLAGKRSGGGVLPD